MFEHQPKSILNISFFNDPQCFKLCPHLLEKEHSKRRQKQTGQNSRKAGVTVGKKAGRPTHIVLTTNDKQNVGNYKRSHASSV